MWWNSEENQENEEKDEVVENEEKDEFAQLEKNKKDALKWAENLPDSDYLSTGDYRYM